MNKILLALQFWRGDMKAAMQVARLVADLEIRHSIHADFMFVSRFDCPQDPETVKYVSRKFNTFTYINSSRKDKGWPAGCNGLWFGTVDRVYSMVEGKRMPPYKAILTFEADSFPLRPDWVARLSEEWDKRKVKLLGPMVKSEGVNEHINGNALVSGDIQFLHQISREIGGCTPMGGWDYVLAPWFKKQGWSDTPLMKSWWRQPTLSADMFESLLTDGTVFLHGVKDDSIIRHVRAKFL